MSAVAGHHYANSTHHFWHCLHLSGTFLISTGAGTGSLKKHESPLLRQDYLLPPSEDFTLPARFNLGLVCSIPSFFLLYTQPSLPFLRFISLSQIYATSGSAMSINLVDRPSTSQAELLAQELASSVLALLARIARFRPRVTCFIGKGI